MTDSPPVCPICFELVSKSDLFKTHYSHDAQHCFHLDCMHEYAKHRLRDAVVIKDRTVTVQASKLPSCPTCRAPLVWASRTTASAAFFLLGAGRNLLELGTVREQQSEHPRLDLCNHRYTRRAALAL